MEGLLCCAVDKVPAASDAPEELIDYFLIKMPADAKPGQAVRAYGPQEDGPGPGVNVVLPECAEGSVLSVRVPTVLESLGAPVHAQRFDMDCEAPFCGLSLVGSDRERSRPDARFGDVETGPMAPEWCKDVSRIASPTYASLLRVEEKKTEDGRSVLELKDGTRLDDSDDAGDGERGPPKRRRDSSRISVAPGILPKAPARKSVHPARASIAIKQRKQHFALTLVGGGLFSLAGVALSGAGIAFFVSNGDYALLVPGGVFAVLGAALLLRASSLLRGLQDLKKDTYTKHAINHGV